MTGCTLRLRKRIRERMAEDYHRLSKPKNYASVGAFWGGLSAGLVYRIIKDPDYWPKDKKILRILKKKAEQFNLREGYE